MGLQRTSESGSEKYKKLLYYSLVERATVELLHLIYSFKKYLVDISGYVVIFPTNYWVTGIRCPDGCIVENTYD